MSTGNFSTDIEGIKGPKSNHNNQSMRVFSPLLGAGTHISVIVLLANKFSFLVHFVAMSDLSNAMLFFATRGRHVRLMRHLNDRPQRRQGWHEKDSVRPLYQLSKGL